ncbi:hypothetical protein HXX76_011471 [Chlamydomonas incerta]|uniref:Uncharacterized protein n=1 Tax=Chlamydomonas incerta TaxID=51695 RepID=A0A835VUV6_CHLIN|nr:hypothetical protein HXX76_011471 [Chlamydomonas incerta]|eukprot:KAG2428770.1 hypothetical protein HXX76_011471 [Chlamydomonas incerta]
MTRRVVLFVVLLASWGASGVVLARNGQASPPTGVARSAQATLPDDVDAARSLLLSLLGPDAASNATLVRPLMPPGTDPCTPTADDWATWAAVNAAAVDSDAAQAWAAKGACGPQWSVALPADNATTSKTNGTGGSWRRNRRLHDVARRLLQPGSGGVAAPTTTVSATLVVPGYLGGPPPCAWKWLSCSNWRIVAVNMSCGGAPRGSSVCTLPRLRGSLPAATPGLSALASMDLSGNNGLTGGLPLSSWQTPWPSLQILNMSGAGLSSGLPSDWSDLPGLTVLDLSQNNIKGTLPPGMAALANLSWLSVAGNSALSGYLPSAWATLGSLLWLDVRSVCRLCGTTDMFDNLTSALTAGSHVNTRCRPDECDLDLGNLHGIFQGVLAGFASVMGLCAIVLVLRRIRDCTHGRSYRTVRLSVVPASRSHRGSSGGGERAMGTDGNSGDAGGGAGGNTRTRSRRARSHRRRGAALTAASVPLYVVEFGADGTSKWLGQLLPEDVKVEVAGAAGSSDPAAQAGAPQAQQPGAAEVETSAAGRAEDGAQPRSEGAASPAALPASAEPEGDAGAASPTSAARATSALVDPSSNSRRAAMVRSNAEAAARIIAEAISNGQAAEAAARAKAREEGLQGADAARPPDAVILQPDGFEVCLGSRVAAAPAEAEAGGSVSAGGAADPASAGDAAEAPRRQDSGADTCGSGSGGSETTGDETPSAAGGSGGAGGSGAAGPSTPPPGVDTSSVSCTLSSSCTDSFNPSCRGGGGGRPDAC